MRLRQILVLAFLVSAIVPQVAEAFVFRFIAQGMSARREQRQMSRSCRQMGGCRPSICGNRGGCGNGGVCGGGGCGNGGVCGGGSCGNPNLGVPFNPVPSFGFNGQNQNAIGPLGVNTALPQLQVDGPVGGNVAVGSGNGPISSTLNNSGVDLQSDQNRPVPAVDLVNGTENRSPVRVLVDPVGARVLDRVTGQPVRPFQGMFFTVDNRGNLRTVDPRTARTFYDKYKQLGSNLPAGLIPTRNAYAAVFEPQGNGSNSGGPSPAPV